MNYVESYVIAVPTANKQKFIEHAQSNDNIFLDLGALRIVECWEDDVPEGNSINFRKAVNANADENIVIAWIEWPDKATRDAAMLKVMNPFNPDPRMDRKKNPLPYDVSRMFQGGFVPLVNLQK